MSYFDKQVNALLRGVEEQLRSDPSARNLQRIANLATAAAVRTGAISAAEPPIIFRGNMEAPEKMFASLMMKGDAFLKQLLKRMMTPNDPLFSRKAKGPPAFSCIYRILSEIRRAIHHKMEYAEEVGDELPEKLKDVLLTFEFTLIDAETPPPLLAATPINYGEYGIAPTEDHAVNFLISMAEVLKHIATTPECMGSKRISRFSLNTTSKHGEGGLGTKTFVEDVKFFFSYAAENREFLERARVYARLSVADNIASRKQSHDLLNRLRGLYNMRPLSEPANLRELRATHARLSGAGAGGGGGAGGRNYQGGGGRKTLKGGRKTLKGGRKTLKGSRKTRRHH
jgi:hypothetical protein